MKKGGAKSAGALGADSSAELALHTDQLVARLKILNKSADNRAVAQEIKSIERGRFALGFINNALMEVYQAHASSEAFSLLYELNYKNFFVIIFNKIKHYPNMLDPRDILQDVFLSIFRYPYRFRSDSEHAFRNWSYSIIRNTILKHLKARSVSGISTDLLSEVIEDKDTYSPLSQIADEENLARFKTFYLQYLMLYLYVFNNYLSERSRLALLYVEVEGKRYREASEQLGVKLENFKMVVCRARKKMHRTMSQLLGSSGT